MNIVERQTTVSVTQWPIANSLWDALKLEMSFGFFHVVSQRSLFDVVVDHMKEPQPETERDAEKFLQCCQSRNKG